MRHDDHEAESPTPEKKLCAKQRATRFASSSAWSTQSPSGQSPLSICGEPSSRRMTLAVGPHFRKSSASTIRPGSAKTLKSHRAIPNRIN